MYYNKGQHDLALLMIDYQDHAAPDNKIRALNTRDRGICLFYCKRYADAISELQARGSVCGERGLGRTCARRVRRREAGAVSGPPPSTMNACALCRPPVRAGLR